MYKQIAAIIAAFTILAYQLFKWTSQQITCDTNYITVNTIEDIRQNLVGYEKIYFDIDETIVMPDTPFIYGLPQTDAYVDSMDQCAQDEMDYISPEMEKTYYESPLRLVDPEMPALIKELREQGKQVLALTSRGLEEDYAWHNYLIIDFFEENGIYFSEVKDDFGIISQTKVGGVIFSNHANKGDVIVKLQGNEPATLVDDTLKKLTKALDVDGICLNALHWTSSFSQEQSSEQKTEYICEKLSEIPKDCDFCSN